ncbi:hypothetical protein [Microbacterium sp. TPU 3598]|uniref:hypothetical protein n=1 Tax=Microbacterium sp. TPU 3598 TaxID=1938334 RepID=UPI000BBAABE2|nr:hypothetical protein [Microbacterium sp. TPU 3598]
MLNKKKIIAAAVVAVLVVAAIIVGIIWATSRSVTSSPEPSPVVSESAEAGEADGFTDQLKSTAISAAATAAVFQGSDTKAARERSYLQAGFTQELAENFTPLWFDVFKNTQSHTIEATGEVLIGAAVSVNGSKLITDVTVKGEPGHRTYRAAVDVDCTPQWSVDQEGPRMGSKFTAIWYVTVDEATGAVLSVEQPAPADLPFNPED